ncbi:Nucleotidyl transferase domain containing protein [Candidatus Nanopelagicaceae bacterium]
MTYQVVVTAGGKDTFDFLIDDKINLKHDVKVGDSRILQKAYDAYASHAARKTIVIRAEAASSIALFEILKRDSSSEVQSSSADTQGALCSALLSIDHIDLSLPLFVVPGDSFITGDVGSLFRDFLNLDAQAGTLLFKANGKRWSYARIDKDGAILEMAEKVEISDAASTGVFYFRSGEIFIRAAEWVLLNNLRTSTDFYVSTAINYLAMAGHRVVGKFLEAPNVYVPLSQASDIVYFRSIHEKN